MSINLLFLFFFVVQAVQAQFNQQDILQGQSAQVLINNLVDQYKPLIILDYDHARDTLFSKIYSIQDSVTCVYTGHKLYLNPSVDPSTAMYSGGSGNGINTEHTYPQSKGASVGNARSDMHHLYPVRASANSARNNFPYAEVDDTETTTWYYLTLSESAPSQYRDYYSELNIHAPAFEPREDHKGNAARAIFYFYTMYKAEADAADPSFFAKQVPTLCQWHLDDPVDSLEWERNYKIAAYQEGKLNPYILDCSLPYRTYCPHLPHNSCFTATRTLADFGVVLYANYPNPAQKSTRIQYELDRSTTVELVVYNALGQIVAQKKAEDLMPGLYDYDLDCNHLSNGVYSYRLFLKQGNQFMNIAKQFLVQHQ